MSELATPDPDTQPYWDAARDGVLLLRRCRDCGRAHLYPRPFCPTCWSEAVDWEEASGRASLHTWSVVERNDLPPFRDRVPYVAAIVELDEGPRMETNVVDCAPEELAIDMPLEVAFRDEGDDLTVPVFRPASRGG